MDLQVTMYGGDDGKTDLLVLTCGCLTIRETRTGELVSFVSCEAHGVGSANVEEGAR